MAKTQLADIIVPAQFAGYVLQRTAEKSDLFQSGIVIRTPDYDERAAQGGNQVNMPHWNDLTGNRQPLVTTYGYGQGGQLNSINYSDGTTPNVGYTFDRLGRLVQTTDVGTRTLDYNAAGEVFEPVDEHRERGLGESVLGLLIQSGEPADEPVAGGRDVLGLSV